MSTNSLLGRWSTTALPDIEMELTSGASEGAIEQLFGSQEIAEMRSWLGTSQARGQKEAVVLLPGLMGSLLYSVRGTTTLVWINPLLFLKGKADYLGLSQDGTRDERAEVDLVPIGAERLVYLKISLALRRQASLFEFPYDWRRPIEGSADLLRDYIEHWADGDEHRQFTLVGHSMGGLVSRAYLARHTEFAERRIKRVIMLGTPHFGAAGAVENIMLGNSMIDLAAKLNHANEMLRLVRNMPSVYQLVPAPPELFPSGRPYPANWDFYNANSWNAEGIRQDYLDAGRRFHELLASSDPQVDLVQIAGCHIDTVVEFNRSSDEDGSPEFQAVRKEEGADSGDGTVPLWAARLPAASLYYVQVGHRDLPKRKSVIEATLELIHHGNPDLPSELPPPRPSLFAEETIEPIEDQAARIRDLLEAGTASESDLAALYFAM